MHVDIYDVAQVQQPMPYDNMRPEVDKDDSPLQVFTVGVRPENDGTAVCAAN